MIISFKMVDGSRYDVPANQYQKEKMFQDLSNDGVSDGWHWWECSECHHDAWYDEEDLTNFCPNCGAQMDGDADV